jgi:outer membrane autotransporter protein
LAGRLKGDGWTAGGYLGWRFASVRASFAVTHSWIGYDGVAGTASGTFNGSRWMVSGGLTGAHGMGVLVIEPSLRVYAMWEAEKSYTDSLGIVQDSRNFFSGRASAGSRVSYPLAAWGATIAPYVGLYGDYYFAHDDAALAGLASTPLLEGWSARATAGVSMRNDHGAQFDLGGEYGGIGSDTKMWTWRARGKLPF